MKFEITAFRGSPEFSLELREFEPEAGYESFLREICSYLGETYLNCHQCPESGIGSMTFQGDKIGFFWTEYSFGLSFDCCDRQVAEQLRERLQVYFHDKNGAYPLQQLANIGLLSASCASNRV